MTGVPKRLAQEERAVTEQMGQQYHSLGRAESRWASG